MDKFQNIHVMRGCIMLCIMAQKLGLETKNLAWNQEWKGFDDLSLALQIGHLLTAGYGYYNILNAAKNMEYDLNNFIQMYNLSLKYVA